jgi:hypothetical protein
MISPELPSICPPPQSVKYWAELYQFRVPGLCDCQACIRRLNEAQLAVIQHTEAMSFQELRQGGHLVWC